MHDGSPLPRNGEPFNKYYNSLLSFNMGCCGKDNCKQHLLMSEGRVFARAACAVAGNWRHCQDDFVTLQ